MLRVVLAVVALVGLHGVANAQRYGVASTRPPDGALELVGTMLPEPPVGLADVPSSFEPEDFLPWTLASGVLVAIVIDRPTQRVYVAIAGENRVLERVLPANAEDYFIALAATELVELDLGALALPPAVAADATPEAAIPVADETTDHAPRTERFVLGGYQHWLGLPGELRAPGGSLGFLHLRPPFAAGAFVDGGGARHFARPVGSGSLHLDYRRAGAQGGLGFGTAPRRRLRFSALALVGVDWVHVDARGTFDGVRVTGGDDRVAATLGAAADLILVQGRFALGLGVGVDWLLGATPYTAFGVRVFDEPNLRLQARVGVGTTF